MLLIDQRENFHDPASHLLVNVCTEVVVPLLKVVILAMDPITIIVSGVSSGLAVRWDEGREGALHRHRIAVWLQIGVWIPFVQVS